MLYNIAAVPLNIDWQQILLHLLNFVILFAGLYLLLYKPVKAFMQKRREHYEKMDKDAEETSKRRTRRARSTKKSSLRATARSKKSARRQRRSSTITNR